MGFEIKQNQLGKRIRYYRKVVSLAMVCLLGVIYVQAQNQIVLDYQAMPPSALEKLDNRAPINISNAPLKEVIRAIGTAYNLNLSIDERINQMVTLRLSDVPVIEALKFLCEKYNLNLIQEGAFFKIEQPQIVEPPPPPPKIIFESGKLSVDLERAPLDQVLKEITAKSQQNIILSYGIGGIINGFLDKAPLKEGLAAILGQNGFVLDTSDEAIWQVSQQRPQESGQAVNNRPVRMNINANLVSLNVSGQSLTAVLESLKNRSSGIEMILLDRPDEVRVTAQFDNLSFSQALQHLFLGTDYTYREVEGVYIIGKKEKKGLLQSKLIRLEHAKSETLSELIPTHLSDMATIQVVKEQNGFLVTGTHDAILEVQSFVNELDIPTPQILIEALVVDFTIDNSSNRGVVFGRGGLSDSTSSVSNEPRYDFGLPQDDDQTGGLNIQGGAEEARRFGDFWQDVLGFSFASAGGPVGSLLRFVGKLPDDFYFRIESLVKEGKANIRSRPHASTLNGHTASLTFGETQYYLLNTTNYPYSPYGSGYYPNTNDPNNTNNTNNDPTNINNLGSYGSYSTQRFYSIDANVTFEITPWVGTSGEVTAEIKPDFKTPQGGFKEGVPPTISSRTLNSTVRLKDGETIILGGLIQERESYTETKVPILGDIPLIKRLFRRKTKTLIKQELVIFVTPHVFYGDERDNERWRALEEGFEFKFKPQDKFNTEVQSGEEKTQEVGEETKENQ